MKEISFELILVVVLLRTVAATLGSNSPIAKLCPVSFVRIPYYFHYDEPKRDLGKEFLKLSEIFDMRGGSIPTNNNNNNNNNKKRRSVGDNNVVISQSHPEEGEQQPRPLVKRKKKQALSSASLKPSSINTHSRKTEPKTLTREAATILRLKREYKDTVQMGIAYDWTKMQSIYTKKLGRRKQSDLMDGQHPDNYSENSNNSDCYIRLGPLGQNLLLWHFSIQGPPNSPYAHGLYHGRIILPRDYPFSPPRIQLLTPNGRFIPRVDICLSASSYHPETWSPQWTIYALVQSLRIHFLTDPNEIGGIAFCSMADKKRLALQSRSWRWRFPSTNIVVDHAAMLAAAQNDTPITTEDATASTTTTTTSSSTTFIYNMNDKSSSSASLSSLIISATNTSWTDETNTCDVCNLTSTGVSRSYNASFMSVSADICLEEEIYSSTADSESNQSSSPRIVSSAKLIATITEVDTAADVIPPLSDVVERSSSHSLLKRRPVILNRKERESSRVMSLQQNHRQQVAAISKGTSVNIIKKHNDNLVKVLFKWSFLFGILLAILFYVP